MLNVKKRDGALQQFDVKKIEAAIEKAFAAEHKFSNPDIIEMLALRVTAEFAKKIRNDVIDIEDMTGSAKEIFPIYLLESE